MAETGKEGQGETVSTVVARVLEDRYRGTWRYLGERIMPPHEWLDGPTEVEFTGIKTKEVIRWLKGCTGGLSIRLKQPYRRGNALNPQGEPFPVKFYPMLKEDETYTYVRRFVVEIVEDTGNVGDKNRVVDWGIRLDVNTRWDRSTVTAVCEVWDTAVYGFFQAILTDAAGYSPEIKGQLHKQGVNIGDATAVPMPGQPAGGNGSVTLPKTGRLQKWKKAWSTIKPNVIQDRLTAHEIARKIRDNQLLQDKMRDCPQSADTLAKIIRAGLAGQLD